MTNQPLLGKRIAVTRAAEQSQDLLAILTAYGAEAISIPAIAITPLADTTAFDNELYRINTYDWLIATSVNGVEELAARMHALGISSLPANIKVGAIGPATAQAFRRHSIEPVFQPGQYVAEGILADIPPVQGMNILLPRADIARETLARGLHDRGARVTEITAYQTVPGDGARRLLAALAKGPIDAITFTSSSTVCYLLQSLYEQSIDQQQAIAMINSMNIAVIGPITAQTAREHGLHIAIEAQSFTTEGLTEAIITYYAQPSKELSPSRIEEVNDVHN